MGFTFESVIGVLAASAIVATVQGFTCETSLRGDTNNYGESKGRSPSRHRFHGAECIHPRIPEKYRGLMKGHSRSLEALLLRTTLLFDEERGRPCLVMPFTRAGRLPRSYRCLYTIW